LDPNQDSRDSSLARLLAENKVERSPVIEVLKRRPVPIVLSALIRLADQTEVCGENALVQYLLKQVMHGHFMILAALFLGVSTAGGHHRGGCD
jgi:hypothetical protein